MSEQIEAILRRARRNHYQPAEAGDAGAPVDQARLCRAKLRRLEQGRRSGELLEALAREHGHDPHAIARTVERGGFFGHDASVHLSPLDRKVHVAGALVAGNDLALHTERVGHDGGEIGIAVDLAGTCPGDRPLALHQVEDGVVRGPGPEQRHLRFAAHPAEPGKLADVIIDAGCVIELRRHQGLPADEQDRQSVGRRVERTVDGDQSTGAGLVGRQHLGAQLLLQMRDQRAHIGIVAAAGAAHRIEPHLLAVEERALARDAHRRGREKTHGERSEEAARDIQSAHRHFGPPFRTLAVRTRANRSRAARGSAKTGVCPHGHPMALATLALDGSPPAPVAASAGSR